MDDLVAWLRAQLDDDERVASRISESQRAWHTAGGWPETGPDTVMAAGGPVAEEVDEADAEHIARWDPARVLAEVDAKRRMLELHSPEPSHYVSGRDGGRSRYIWDEPGTPQCEYCASLCHSHSGLNCEQPDAPWPCDTVRLLALPFADRPGYRAEWRP